MEDKSIQSIIRQCIGQAALCWTEAPHGVFDSTKALVIADEIMRAIEKYKDDQAFLDQAMIAAMQSLIAHPKLFASPDDVAENAACYSTRLLEKRNKMIGGGE